MKNFNTPLFRSLASFRSLLRGGLRSNGMMILLGAFLPLSSATAGENYQVIVKTSDQEDADTDDDIYITLFGEKGNATKRLDSSLDDFERGAINEFSLWDVNDLGRISKVRFRLDGNDAWRGDWVKVLGPTDLRFPHWDKYLRLAGPTHYKDSFASTDDPANYYYLHDIYRFDLDETEIDDDGSFDKGLDARGRKFLAAKRQPGTLPFSAETQYFGHSAVYSRDKHFEGAPFDDRDNLPPKDFMSEAYASVVNESYRQQKIEKEAADLKREQERLAKEERERLRNYNVAVLTKDVPEAGTDGDVYLTVYGDIGSTFRLKLDGPGNDQQQGKWDYYEFQSRNLGRITHVKLEQEGSDSWNPNVVYVLGPTDDEKYPNWRREQTTKPDGGVTELMDFYRFAFVDDPELDETASIVRRLDDEGGSKLGWAKDYDPWSKANGPMLHISGIKCISPAIGINDTARVMGQIGGFVTTELAKQTPFVGELGTADVIVEFVVAASGSDDAGEMGEKLVEWVDGFTAGADELVMKVDGVNAFGEGMYVSMDKGEVLDLDLRLSLHDEIEIELIDFDVVESDTLGKLRLNPLMPSGEKQHTAYIARKSEGSLYEIRYRIYKK